MGQEKSKKRLQPLKSPDTVVDDHSEKAMIKKRVDWAGCALQGFTNACATDPDYILQDLLTDLHHWADSCGFNFRKVLQKSESIYQQEIADLKREVRNG